MKRSIIIATALLTAATLQAATYYVDYDNGNDANAGTAEAQAWKHCPIDTAATGNAFAVTLNPGDEILFKGGTIYRGKFESSSYYAKRVLGSGTVGNPITLKGNGWGAEDAIFDGSKVVTGWTQCTSAADANGNSNYANIWKVTLSDDLAAGDKRALSINLYQGTKMLAYAQYPNQPNTFYFDDTKYYEEADSQNTSETIDGKLADLDDDGLVGKYVGLWYGNNAVGLKHINTYDAGSGKITYDAINSPYGWYSILNSMDDDIFDMEGDFCYDESTHVLYCWPYGGADPNSADMTVSYYTTCMTLWNDDYVSIEGFTIQKYIGYGIAESSTPYTEGLVVRDNTIRWCRYHGGGHTIHLKSTNNALVEGNLIQRNAGNPRGIGLLGGRGHVTKNNEIDESGKTGIYYAGVKHGMILGNRIVDNMGKHANAISTYQQSDSILIADNVVINSNIAYTANDADHIFLYNNIFVGSQGMWAAACWGGVKAISIYHNLFIGYFSFATGTEPVVAKNNIFDSGIGTRTNWDVDNNIIANETNMSTVFRNGAAVKADLQDVHKYTELTNVTTVHLKDSYAASISIGTYLIFDNDGVARLISSAERKIHAGNWRTEIVFSPALDTVFATGIEVWNSGDDLTPDYHLSETSVARDSGVDISAELPTDIFPDYDFAKDIDGNVRTGVWDIGPFEYTSSSIGNPVMRQTLTPLLIPNPLSVNQARQLPGSVYGTNGVVPAVMSGGVYLWDDGTQLRKILISE